MTNLISIARPYLAGMLLFAIVCQQLPGRWYVNRVCATAVEIQMNRLEEQIARELKAKSGIETRVKVLTEGQTQALQQLGYAAPFVFTEEVDGQTLSFTLEQERIYVFEHPGPAADESTPGPLPASRTLLAKVFPDFYFSAPNLLSTRIQQERHDRVFVFNGAEPDYNPAVPAPPPWQRA